MMYLGDFPTSAMIDFNWSSNAADGASITRATNGTVSVYKANGTTQSTAGVTDTEDFDALTGIHHVRIDTSADGTFYAAGSEFSVVLSGATIDGEAVNAVLAHFSIERSGGALALLKNGTYGLSALETIVDDLEGRLTAARAGYLDNLSAGAVALQASVDDLEGRLTATRAGYLDNLSGGSVATAAALATVDDFIDTEVAAILAAVDTEVAAIKAKTDYLPSATAGAAGGVLIAGSNAATTVNITGNITGNVSGSVGSVTGAVGSVTGNVGGNVTGSVGSVAAGGITAASIATGAIDADALATDAVTEIATAVNAEVVDALATDTYAELGAVPAATSSLKDKITWLFMLARNARLTTATSDVVRNDANNATIGTSTLSDDGTTFTRGEYA